MNSGVSEKQAEKIVDVVRGLRESGEYEFAPTIRGAIMIARSCKAHEGAQVAANNAIFRQICRDILSSETSRLGVRDNHLKVKQLVENLITKYCGSKKIFSLSNVLKTSKISKISN